MPISATSRANSSFSDTATNNELTGTLTWNAGDYIIVLGVTEDNGVALPTPTVTGLTFASMSGSPSAAASSCKVYGWTATAAASGSGTLNSNRGSAGSAGIYAWALGGVASVGTPVIVVSTAKTASLVHTGTGAWVLGAMGDWSADTDVTVTPSPATNGTVQVAAVALPGQFTGFVLEWSGQNAGTDSYGIANASGTGNMSKIFVEVLPTAGAPVPLLLEGGGALLLESRVPVLGG